MDPILTLAWPFGESYERSVTGDGWRYRLQRVISRLGSANVEHDCSSGLINGVNCCSDLGWSSVKFENIKILQYTFAFKSLFFFYRKLLVFNSLSASHLFQGSLNFAVQTPEPEPGYNLCPTQPPISNATTAKPWPRRRCHLVA